jgi:hypothetical protein
VSVEFLIALTIFLLFDGQSEVSTRETQTGQECSYPTEEESYYNTVQFQNVSEWVESVSQQKQAKLFLSEAFSEEGSYSDLSTQRLVANQSQTRMDGEVP